jgi:hypothetical protein
MMTLTCDACKKVVSEHEWEEYQEFYRIEYTGGYGNSTTGDTVHVCVDLCQHCLYDRIKDVLPEKPKYGWGMPIGDVSYNE